MTITSPPKLQQIYWTAFSPVEGDSSPVDALRFETYAERLGNYLFPGITNRVERVRYFGMVCAGIQAAGAEVGQSVTGREHTRRVRERFVRFEAAWAFAQVVFEEGKIKHRPPGATQPRLRPEYRALRGANRVLSFWEKTKDREAVDGRGKYKLLQAQEAQGGLGSYLVSLREHGFVHPDRLALTGAGAELVSAFYDNTQAKTKAMLSSDGVRGRAAWIYAGARYGLPNPSDGERLLIANALFASDRTLGRVVATLPPELRDSARTHEAFHFIAASGGLDAAVARYTLAFDDFRRACLTLFSQVGEGLRQAAAPRRIAELLPAEDVVALADEVQRTAAAIGSQQAPPGLAPVAVLAAELQACSGDDVVSRLVAFHRSEGRRWIEPAGGDRFQLGAAGTFQDPGDGFHGYTLNAALSVYADTEMGAA